MGLTILFILNLALTGAGFFFLWRRLEQQKVEIARLRAALAAPNARARKAVKRAGGAVVALPGVETEIVESPLARAARAWGLKTEAADFALRGPTLSPETMRGLVLALMAVAPAAGFFFGADQPAIVASGLAIAAAMMVVALRPIWRAAAWASVLTASAWALVGFALGAAHADPVSYSFCVALAGATGILHAHKRRATPGAAMALSMAAAALALGSQVGMISAAGAGFAIITAAAAIVGAMSLRLEAMHLAGFGAAVIGLFVLSGQYDAAIWFTPAATWAGALFFAVALVRVPQLGPRGVALAGTGAFAPLGVITALHDAQHGLADAYAAAGAFLSFGALLAALIAVTSLRRAPGLAAMRLTLWVLVLGVFCAVSAAISLALPAPFAAAAFVACAFALAVLNTRAANTVWQAFAVACGILAAVFALIGARFVLGEAAIISPWLATLAGLVAPATIAGAAAFVFARSKANATAAFFEALAIALSVIAANVFARLLFSNGATLLTPVSFVETGVHAAIWLAAALAIGVRAHHGASAIRIIAISLLTIMALVAMAFASLLWIGDYWQTQTSAALNLDYSLGFLIPGALFSVHWVFWRARGDDPQTRITLAAAALTLAAFITMEASNASGLPPWAGPLSAALSFALAIGINFAPGVVSPFAPKPPVTLRDKSPSPTAEPAAH
jgi:hypothetical protein